MNKPTLYSIIFLFAFFGIQSVTACPDPPENDDPCITSINPPIDLTGGGFHEGTTCCARGPSDTNTDGSNADFESVECNASTQDAAVWYMVVPDPTVVGFDITLEIIDAGGPFSMEIYSGAADSGCTGDLNFLNSRCSITDTEIVKMGNCFSSSDTIFIKLASDDSEANCGGFVIAIVDAECDLGTPSETCLLASQAEPIEVITNTQFSIDYLCLTGCLDYACPEIDDFGGCSEFLESPTVWYRITTDELANQMFTTVESNGNWDPVWSVFGAHSCDSLVLLDFGGSPACSNGSNTPELLQTAIMDEFDTYYMAITADPASIPFDGIQDGSFELCAASAINAIICMGEEVGDCGDESLVMEVTERENVGESLEGPFCPGEEVTINVSFTYDASESGAEQLAGFVPVFGNGWDLDNYNYNLNAPTGNGFAAQWYEVGSDLAPSIQENNPIFCTFINKAGELEICNQLCEPCSECDQQGMSKGDAIPSGYFWVTEGENPGCENNGSPGEGWGIGSTISEVNWTFNMKVKSLNNLDCNTVQDLSIKFQTFSHGMIGCWEDPYSECYLDRMMFSPYWYVDCEYSIGADVESLNYCSNAITNIHVFENGALFPINITFEDNPNVLGESTYSFENGGGYIEDQLINLTDEVQVVRYFAIGVIQDGSCAELPYIIEVKVYPSIESEIDQVYICEDGCADINPQVTGGAGMPYNYEWSTGESISLITVCPAVITTYTVTVSDDIGCIDVAEVAISEEVNEDFCDTIMKSKLVYDFFHDENENGIKEDEEASLQDGSFRILENDLVVYNTAMGTDTLYLQNGVYTIIFNLFNDDWRLTTQDSLMITLSDSTDCETVLFGISPIVYNREFKFNNIWSDRCNTETEITLFLKNKGEKDESGIIWAELDSLVIHDTFLEDAALQVDTIIGENKVGWFFSDLSPFHSIEKTVGIRIPGPPDVAIGTEMEHVFYLEVDNVDGSSEVLLEGISTKDIRCGYDPNDKAVEPYHEQGYTHLETEELIYKIRFQNTGNDYTEDVRIIDTLSEFLDISSVEYIGSSHHEFLTFSRVGDRILSFRFDNIYLPDSTSDLEGSQGFIIFSVNLNSELPEGTSINNTAHIYFDNNPAVVTNTIKSILYDDLDEDGYYSIEDCDESNSEINPGALELPNNDTDEDCDGVALIIDADMDGFNSDEDCDDMNADIHPNAEEIVNNEIDENCDGLAVIIDNDNDGYHSDEDCDDGNSEINPGAVEIPDNGIDEDCDGEDMVTINTSESIYSTLRIYPNPIRDNFHVEINDSGVVGYSLMDINGKFLMEGTFKNNTIIDLSDQLSGVYILKLESEQGDKMIKKIIKL